jgi:hypothetical protein
LHIAISQSEFLAAAATAAAAARTIAIFSIRNTFIHLFTFFINFFQAVLHPNHSSPLSISSFVRFPPL